MMKKHIITKIEDRALEIMILLAIALFLFLLVGANVFLWSNLFNIWC